MSVPTGLRHFDGDPATEFAHRIRVRYAETDQMGVAHHANHVVWFEEARSAWMRERGRSYRDMEESGLFLQVVGVAVRYLASLRYEDVLEVRVRLKERRRNRVTLAYLVTRVEDGVAAAEGETTLAAVGRDGKLTRLPDEIR